METNDVVRAAPTALFCVRKFPELPTVVEVRSGADLQALIAQALGGEPGFHRGPTRDESALGILAVYGRDDVRLHVHSHPDAFAELAAAVELVLNVEMGLN